MDDDEQQVDGRASVGRRAVLRGVAGLALAGAMGLRAGPASASPTTRLAQHHGPEAAARWLRTVYAVVAAEGLTPPAAARAYAYCAVAMYEAVLPGMPRYRSLAGQLAALGPAPVLPPQLALDLPTTLAAATMVTAQQVLPSTRPGTALALTDRFDSDLAARRAAGVPQPTLQASVAFGRAVGEHVARWAATDGAAQARGLPYAPPVGPGLWEPTPPNFGRAVEPHCHLVRTMVLHSADEVAPQRPVPFSADPGSDFAEQARTTYRQSFVNTDEMRDIARFWTDNPTFSGMPAGHWMHLAVQAAEQHGLRLDLTVEALARTGVALHDAFVNCWTWKYRYNLIRPVSYVRHHLDPAWSTWVNTPQFPEYTSGHSVGSRAASTVLTGLLGRLAVDDTTLATTAGIGQRTRHYRDFHAAADTAAASRLYGGIHYPMGIQAGKDQGDAVGALVVRRLHTRR